MTHSVAFGTRIAGRYEVAGRPLMGGMGIVFLCYDHQEDRPVALKTFKPEYLSKRSLRDRFLREGTIWMDLDRHPHVVRCYNVVRLGDGREVYLVLEQVAKVDGKPDASLRSWLLPGQPLPLETALLFGLQIVRGMRHAVERLPGFVHRDLKPENVLVGADQMAGSDVQRLRATDFGLAGVLAEMSETDILSPEKDVEAGAASNPRRTRLTHGVVGTPPYMAPEQWRGEQLTAATDVYAFGCMLQEMLSGVPAVNGRSKEALMAAHLSGEIAPLPAELPRDLQELVQRCVALDPGQRYRNWDLLEAALADVYGDVTGTPVPALPDPDELAREERVALGWAQSALGASYLDIGKAAVAVDYFERAQIIGATEQIPRLKAAGFGNLGLAYLHLGDLQQAIKHYEQALTILRETGDRRSEGNVLGNLGNAYRRVGKTQLAIGYQEQALAIARQVGDYHGEVNCLTNLGAAFGQLGDRRSAISYFKKALTLQLQIGDRHGAGITLGNLGNAHGQLGDAQRAIDYFEQALAVSREIGDRHSEGSILGNIGNVYYQMGNMQQAIIYQAEALEIRREIGDRNGEGVDLGNLGSIYGKIGDVDRASEYFEQALVIHRETGNTVGEAYASANLATALAQKGETAKALPLAQRAVELHERSGHIANAQQAQQLVAQLQGQSPPPTAGDPQAAFQAFQQADSPAVMRATTAQHPILTDPGFMDAIAQVIQQAPPQLQPAFQQRLDWLRQIASEQGR